MIFSKLFIAGYVTWAIGQSHGIMVTCLLIFKFVIRDLYMQLNKTALSILFAGLCAAGIVAGVWGYAANGGAVAALSAAVIMLVAAQLVLFLILAKNETPVSNTQDLDVVPNALSSLNKRLAGVEKQIRKVGKNQQQLAHRFDELPAHLAPQIISHLNRSALAEPHSVLGHQPLGNDKATSEDVSPSPTLEAVLSTSPHFTEDHTEINHAPIQTGPAYSHDERLTLFLEPIIDTEEMNTAFYRAELAFRNDLGEQSRLCQMSQQIEDDGFSGVMDMKLFTRLGPVIERLATRGNLLGVICPISRQSFGNHDFLEELTRYLQEFPELARVLVIEISQADLAQLSEDGMTGLAFLAQVGATFCLGGAGLESPDLGTLASLGFRLLDLDYPENMERYKLAGFGSNGLAAELRKDATSASMTIIGSGLQRKSQKDILNNLIDFGRGSLFSPPRAVRTNLNVTQQSSPNTPHQLSGTTKAA